MSGKCLTRRGFLGRAACRRGGAYRHHFDRPGAAGVPPASARVTVGKIGCGGQGSGLGGVTGQVVAVSDCWKDRRDRWVAQAKCRAYTDFREMLACDDIDAVVVASTDSWHVHHTVAAAKAGKDVYCEKPLGVSVARGPNLPRRCPTLRPHVPIRHAAAVQPPLPLRLRAGPQRLHRRGQGTRCVIAPDSNPRRFHRTLFPCRTWTTTCGSARRRGGRTAGRPWAAAAGGTTTTTPSASSPAGAPPAGHPRLGLRHAPRRPVGGRGRRLHPDRRAATTWSCAGTWTSASPTA